jgi:hypothetical protein
MNNVFWTHYSLTLSRMPISWIFFTLYMAFHDVITNICNKKTTGPTLMELLTATGKLKKFFWQLEMSDVCTTGDTAHIHKIFKFLPYTCQHGCIDILHCCNDPYLQPQRGHVAVVGHTSTSHHCHVCGKNMKIISMWA